MGAKAGFLLIYLLATLISAKSQYYNGYGQYGQYYPGQHADYNPYQQYVSNDQATYNPYYSYPAQSYYPQSYYPQSYYPQSSYPQSYYPQSSYSQGYYPQSYPAYSYPTYQTQNYPYQSSYPSVYPQYGSYQSYPTVVNNGSSGSDNSTSKNSTSQPFSVYPLYTKSGSVYTPSPYITNGNQPTNNVDADVEDPYANIETEVIDVDPKDFNYFKRYFRLGDDNSPVDVIGNPQIPNVVQNQQQSPYYTVQTESRSQNFSSVPQSVNIHDVQNKSYSFKRTFTVDPNKKGNAVINLNFVNGVQVTTEQPDDYQNDIFTTPPPSVTEENVEITTENDEPDNVFAWMT